MINKKGFTLVELLVVIAIIGILSSVAVVNLNSARVKARVGAAQGSLSSLIPAVILCHDGSNELNNGTGFCTGVADNGTPAAGSSICAMTGAPDWPSLPSTDWSYSGSCNSSSASGTFTYGATDGTTVVTCTEAGCST